MPESGRARDEEPMGIGRRMVLAALLTVITIAVCQLLFPNRLLREPGLVYWLLDLAVASYLGVFPGLLTAGLLCLPIALGPHLPGSPFSHTPRNEARLIGSAIIFGATSLIAGFVKSRIGKESEKAQAASRTASAEVERRRHAESELADSERFRQTVVESALDAILTVDADRRIVQWNKHASDMFGFADLAADVPLLPSIFDEPNQIEPLFQLSDPGSSTRVETVACDRSGRKFHVEVSATEHVSADGTVIVVFVRDISERHRAEAAMKALTASLEQRVKERTAELEAKNRELEQFSYSVSHDLRSPLRAITMATSILQSDHMDRLGEDGIQEVRRAEAAARRMNRLIDDLLDYARVASKPLERIPMDLGEMAKAVFSEVAGTDVPQTAAELTVEPGLVVQADPILVRVVMQNLIENAVKFTRQASPRRIEVGAAPGGAVFVRDNGVGFDPTYAERLFEPFERFHEAAQYPGSGIGLATVQRIVERHGGRVWAESQPGQGATFFFTLDKQQEQAAFGAA